MKRDNENRMVSAGGFPVLMVCALFCEARPIIARYHLKKDFGSKKFELFRNGGISLIISGSGCLRSAVASTYLLQNTSSGGKTPLMLNIGICGAADRKIKTGLPVLASRIIHHETGRSYYPDILFRIGMREGMIESFGRPVISAGRANRRDCFIDMEAAGFAESALVFLPPHAVQCLKIVSDHLEGKPLSPDHVSGLVEKNIPWIGRLAEAALSVFPAGAPELGDNELSLLKNTAERLRLTRSQGAELDRLAMEHKIRGGSPSEILAGCDQITVRHKKERNILFDDIRKKFAAKNI